MNKIQLTGHLCSEPEITQTTNGHNVCKITLGVRREIKSGNQETDFVPIVLWNKHAEFVCEYAKKGTQLGISGRLALDQSEKNGEKKTYTSVVVDSVEILSGGKPKDENADKTGKKIISNLEEVDTADLPF